jgi:hypothetical protein
MWRPLLLLWLLEWQRRPLLLLLLERRAPLLW